MWFHPSIATFSSHLHGIKLGSFLKKAREAYHANHLTSFQMNALEQYHIHWDYESYRLHFLTLPSLDNFEKIYNNVRVPQAFIVPSINTTWPKDCGEWNWEFNLIIGDLKRIPCHYSDDRIGPIAIGLVSLLLHVVRALNERAFAWDIFEEDFRTIVIALKTFGELKGNLLVPQSFQVPATS